MPRPISLPAPDVIKKVLELRKAGHTKSQIRDATGATETHIEKILRANRDTLPPAKPGNRSKAPAGAA